MDGETEVVAFEDWVRVPVTLARAESISVGATEAVGYVEMRGGDNDEGYEGDAEGED